MDRDGSNNHCIVPDADAKYPAWSPDGGRIGYGKYIIDTTGNIVKTLPSPPSREIYDWGPADSNEVLIYLWGDVRKCGIYNLSTDEEETLSIDVEKWSPDGRHFIGGKTIYRRNGEAVFNLYELIK